MENTTNTDFWYILPIANNYSLEVSVGRFFFLETFIQYMRCKAKKPVSGIIIESKNGPLAFSRGPSSSVYSTYFHVAEHLNSIIQPCRKSPLVVTSILSVGKGTIS